MILRDRNLLPGNSRSRAAKTGAAKGHCEGPRFPVTSSVVVWTVMVDCAPETLGVTDAGEKVIVPPGRPVAESDTTLVKGLPAVAEASWIV